MNVLERFLLLETTSVVDAIPFGLEIFAVKLKIFSVSVRHATIQEVQSPAPDTASTAGPNPADGCLPVAHAIHLTVSAKLRLKMANATDHIPCSACHVFRLFALRVTRPLPAQRPPRPVRQPPRPAQRRQLPLRPAHAAIGMEPTSLA